MANSTDWDELLWAWQGWRDATGKLMPDMYAEFVDLLNEAAVMNGNYNPATNTEDEPTLLPFLSAES